MAETKHPKVFISYAWEDDLKTWVLDFATRLRSDGINAILDQWETVPGDQLPEFMEKSVRESDFVVFVCTPTYKRKSDRRKGGVGYEGHIITGEVFQKNNHRKFIPILQKGKWAVAAPSWATSKLFIDFRGNPYSEASYQQLLNTLFGKSPTAPPVRDDLVREKLEREAAEKSVREKAEREAIELVERERAEREANEKIVQEKAMYEIAEKAKREAADKEEREAGERAAHEEAERETAEKLAREKIEKEYKRKREKIIRDGRRKKLLLDIRYRLTSIRLYVLPILLGIGVIAGLIYLFFFMSQNVPVLSTTPTSRLTLTLQPSITSTETLASTEVAISSSTSTKTPNPTPVITLTVTPNITSTFSPNSNSLITCLYTVQKNSDTFSGIASRFGIGWNNYRIITCALNSENLSCNAALQGQIRPGWQLVIPDVIPDVCIQNGGTIQQ